MGGRWGEEGGVKGGKAVGGGIGEGVGRCGCGVEGVCCGVGVSGWIEVAAAVCGSGVGYRGGGLMGGGPLVGEQGLGPLVELVGGGAVAAPVGVASKCPEPGGSFAGKGMGMGLGECATAGGEGDGLKWDGIQDDVGGIGWRVSSGERGDGIAGGGVIVRLHEDEGRGSGWWLVGLEDCERAVGVRLR